MEKAKLEDLLSKEYRLIAIDVDDTLLTDDLIVTEGTKAALAEAVAAGNVVTLATGRMYSSAVQIAAQLELNVPIITYQGALIKNSIDGKVLYERPVPEDAALDVVAFAEARGLHIQGYVEDRLIAKEDNDKIVAYAKLTRVPYIVNPDFRALARRGSTKLLIIDEPAVLDALIPELREVLGDRAHVTKSKPHYLEVVHPEATKGHALLHLAAHYGVAREQTIAVGDSWNDHEMVEAAGLGVAMANAVEPLKAAADYITRSNNDEGVRAVVETFLLRK
ncbi:Cof-type HAD-IIB family hydrolase [Paenibacillus sp. TRM 82003]|nr:Cof-type HAD-IIB family hydrolase [Paenibacillus sp. TRM 82003]